jgi:hypothetical protein
MAFATIHRNEINERTNTEQHQSLSQRSERQRQPQVARSQSIKILRNDSNSIGHCSYATDEFSRKAWEEDISQLEEQYESATLQMYYRITEYRMRKSFPYSDANNHGSAAPAPSDRFALSLPSNITMNDKANDTEDSSATSTTYISEENGAIFEMDL